MLRSHHTKLNWLELACNRRNDSCYDGCGDVYGRAQGLAAPLTLIPTLFLTITLCRSHLSIVQIICCERVLTRVASARADPGTARAAGVANRRTFITRSDTALRGAEEPRMYSVRPRYCRELPRDRATRRVWITYSIYFYIILIWIY